MGTRRWWRILVVFGFLLAGCSIPEDPSWTTVAITDEGIVAIGSVSDEAGHRNLLSTDDGTTWTDDGPRPDIVAADVSKLRELCLQTNPDVCVRADGARILESNDGGQTYDTAWELDLRGEWLTRQLDPWGRATIVIGTMVETDTGAVVVSVGDLPPVRRAPGGEWNPTEAQLRRFPIGGAFWALAGIGALALAFASNRVRLRLAVPGPGLIYLGTLTMRYSSRDLVPMAYALGMLTATVVFAYVMVMAINFRDDDGPLSQDYTDPWWTPNRVAPWALPAVLLPATMSAWAWDLMSWDVAEVLWFGGIGVSLVISLIQMRRQKTQAKVEAQS